MLFIYAGGIFLIIGGILRYFYNRKVKPGE